MKRVMFWLLLSLCLVGGEAIAQNPPATSPAVPAKLPEIAEVILLKGDNLIKGANLARVTYQLAVKTYEMEFATAQQGLMALNAEWEAANPGFTIDWPTKKAVPKKAVK